MPPSRNKASQQVSTRGLLVVSGMPTSAANRDGGRAALKAIRSRPGWSAWRAVMAGDARLVGVSRLLE